MKLWLEKNNIEIYSTHNEEKSVVAERYIITLKHKIKKYLTSISKNVYIDKLDDIVNKYNNTYYRTIKMKEVDIKPTACIDASKEINNKDPKFKIVILLEYQNRKTFLEKALSQIGLKKIL